MPPKTVLITTPLGAMTLKFDEDTSIEDTNSYIVIMA